MNFRSLDPRDPREGLSGAGEIDRTVWAEFFDAENGCLLVDRIESEFKMIWGSLEETIIEGVGSEFNDFKNAKNGRIRKNGQGRLNDPVLRKAIEMRALDLAKQHFQSVGFEVEDTGDFESFDLRCFKDGKEIRVEVKGTTGAGNSILLTTNEVRNAQSRVSRVDLFIVSSIGVLRSPEEPQALGGTVRHIQDWTTVDEHLQPASYTYIVPPLKSQ